MKKLLKTMAAAVLCVVNMSTQCMMNGVKTILNGLSTSVGIGLPSLQILIPPYLLYKTKTEENFSVNEHEKSRYVKLRKPFEAEELLLRPHVTQDVKILIEQENGYNSSSSCAFPDTTGYTVVLAEQAAGTPPSLSITNVMALKKEGKPCSVTTEEVDNVPAEDLFIAQVQHEMGHLKENHCIKKTAFDSSVAATTTIGATQVLKKWYPKNAKATLAQVAKRSLVKSVGGVALLVANKQLSNLYSKHCEYVADGYIEKSKIPGQIVCLDSMDFRKKNPAVTTNVETQSNVTKYAQKIEHLLHDSHPTIDQRKERLKQRMKQS